MLGIGSTTVALQLFVVDAARSAETAVSLLFLATAVPQLLGFVVGPWVDRQRPWTLMVTGELVQALAMLLLFALLPKDWPLYFILVVAACAAAVVFLASRKLLAGIVSRDQLRSGVAWIAFAANAQNLLGPPVGAALYSAGGARGAFAFAALSSLLSAVAVTIIGVKQSRNRANHPISQHQSAESAKAAPTSVRHLVTSIAPFRAILTASLFVLGGGAIINVAIVMLLRGSLGLPPRDYGLLLAVFGAGAILATPTLTHAPRANRYSVLIAGATTLAIGVSALSVVEDVAALGLILLTCGFSNSAFLIAREEILQRVIPSSSLATAGGVLQGVSYGGIIAGYLSAGPVIQSIGVRPSLALTAFLVIIGAALALYFFITHAAPRIRTSS